jgi:hypothetical protein
MMRAVVFIILCLTTIGATRVDAQNPHTPPGWRWWFDRPAPASQADSAWSFQQMAPGWHLTTGPGGLLYPTAERASGLFTLVADFIVFPETSNSGFGIFFGGEGVESNTPTYLAALLRRDGALSVVRRVAGAETVLVPWTHHAAIKAHPGAGTVTNRLRVNASADSLRVFVNDSAIVRIAIESSRTEGRFGFRVGESVNLHITILDYLRHLAPARSR